MKIGAVYAARPVLASEGSQNADWTLENERVAAVYGWHADGTFRLVSFRDKRTGRLWTTAFKRAAGLVTLEASGLGIGGRTPYSRPAVSQADIDKGGKRLVFELLPRGITAGITFEAEVYPGQPFVRQRYRFRNLGSGNVTVTAAAFLEASFETESHPFRAFRVSQWVDDGSKGNFEPEQAELAAFPDGWVVSSGSYEQHCAWMALRDARDSGLVFGWEFNGRARLSAAQDFATASLNLKGDIAGLNQPLEPGDAFESPAVFMGSFRGDWDEAGFRTQRFVEAVLAAPMPDRQLFPYVIWDSWGYQDNIDEELLRRAADVATQVGVELFTVDLGWAQRLGDWRADPARFPSGMRALSDYVHAKGMKFGLHFPLLEADPASAVLRRNPDWTSSISDEFYGAVSLCPGHEPVKQWLISETLRLIREYNIDWLLQDGENMVKFCTKRTHTHDGGNSNYANSVKGLDEIIAAVRRAAPQTAWENCQSGGRMMTYQMVRDNETSITSDDSDALTTRQAVYGASFPFPPRYTDRYLGEKTVSKYQLRSGMFGGPWILMQRITEWRELDIQAAASEVAVYKSLRRLIRDGKVFHLTPRPDGRRNEAIQSHNSRMNRSVIFVFRPHSAEDSWLLKPRGLSPNVEYRVRLEEAATVMIATGRDLMERGIEVPLPTEEFAEIVHLIPASAGDPT